MIENKIRVDKDLLSEIIYQQIREMLFSVAKPDYEDANICTGIIMEELEEFETNKVYNR